MTKPLVPEDIKRARPAVYLARAAAANLRAFITGATPVNAAKQMFGQDLVTEVILRAATPPAAISGTSGWAQSLAGVAILDLVQSITSLSAAADVIDRALKLDLTGIAEYRVPSRPLTAAEAGQWTAEGMAAPVRTLSFSNAALLHPHKLQVKHCLHTAPPSRDTNIQAVVCQTLGEATGLALDLQMWSADPGDATKPPGLFAGATAIDGTNVMTTDLGKLFAALAAHGGGKTAVIIAALPQAVTLKATVGPKWDYDIIASTALAPGTVAVLEIASFVSGFGSTAEFNMSKVAAVHMEADTPADISGGTPSPATPVQSVLQIDAIALKTSLSASWGLMSLAR